MLMDRSLARLGAALAFLAVAAGAFGAHGLKARLSFEAMDWYRTAVLYQFFHALALLSLAGFAKPLLASGLIRKAGWILFAGVIIFSGSLYALALGAPRALGMVTPIGGMALLVGWAMLAFAAGKWPSD
jgi:uncharacterized membrane protein YgdD (TMEM256/DUF423 family)